MSSTLLWTHVWRVLDLRSPFQYLLGRTPSWITVVSITIQDNFRVYFIFFVFAGLLELKPGTILFACPLTVDGVYHEEDDIVEAWCLDG